MKKKILSAVLACAATMSLATCAFADAPASADPGATTPGATDAAETTVEVKLGEITDKGIEGDKLNEKIFAGDLKDKTWKDVTKVVFTSKDTFGVEFSVNEGAIKDDPKGTWFKMGVNELAKAEETGEFRTTWTLGEDELKAITAVEGKKANGFVKLITEKGKTAEVTATVTVKAAAEPDVPTNKPTGIALAVAPAALAVAFVSVAAVMSKKKKG